MNGSIRSSSPAGPVVDADHPWLGLYAYTEEAQAYFFGRDNEIREMFTRVRENPLTILFGQSGLGKSSLLGAGLIPKLRIERYRPVLLRLDFSEGAPPLVQQTIAALGRALRGMGRKGPSGAPEELPAVPDAAVESPGGAQGEDPAPQNRASHASASLWELLHHSLSRPEDLREHPPVLIFDQFEEMFTQGGPRNAEVKEWFIQTSDLIENRPPAALQERFRSDRQMAREFDPAPTPARVVITLRGDYLSHLERWKGVLPSLMRNRMALHLLTGPQALEVAVRPGGRGAQPIVSEAVGEQIVRKVARQSDSTPLEAIEAVPPFLSLLCEQLNAARLAAGLNRITPELVATRGDNILDEYYKESFRGQPAAVRSFVEDHLVSSGGHRNTVTREDALNDLRDLGVASPEVPIDALIARRLLTAEERGGLPRLELTHDVLTPLVVRSRTARKEHAILARQRRRFRRLVRVSVLFGLFGVAMAALFLYAWQQKENADKNLQDSMQARVQAVQAGNVALAEKRRADEERLKAEVAKKQAETERNTANALRSEAERQKTNALDALEISTKSLAEAERQKSNALASAKEAKTERARAQEAEQEAQKQRVKVESVVTYMLHDLSDNQRPVGHVDLLRDLTEQVLMLYKTETTNHDQPVEALSHRFMAYMSLGQALALQGEHVNALRALKDGMEIAQQVSARCAGTNNWPAEICLCHLRIGDLMRAGTNSVAALGEFQKGREIAQKGAGEEPTNDRWQLRLLESRGRISEVLSELGDTAGARANRLAAVNIAKHLVEANPAKTEYQRALSVCYTKAASMSLAELDAVQAEKWIDLGLSIAEKLVMDNPGNPELQSDLAASHEARGDRWLARRKPGMALEHYETSRKIRQDLVERDPNNLDYQSELLRADLKIYPVRAQLSHWWNLGEYARAYGEAVWHLVKPAIVEQNEASEKALKKAQQLADKDPGNMPRRRDLALGRSRRGDVLLRAGKNDDALKQYEDALEIRKQLAASDPDSLSLQFLVALSHVSRAAALRRLSRHEEAAAAARQAFGFFEALVSRWPENAVFLEGPRVARKDLRALPQIDQHQLRDAINAFTRAFSQAARPPAKESATEKDIAAHGSYCSELAAGYFFNGEVAQALAEAREAVAVWETLSQTASGDLSYQTNRVRAVVALGAFQILNGQPAAATEIARRALALDSSRVEFKAILAMGCLSQGQFEEACAIILANKATKVGLTRTFPEAILDDLRRLRDKALVPPDLDQLERRLASDPAKALQ